MAYWLVKSEPSAWSWDDQAKKKITHWDGVRNYQARNFLKQMKMQWQRAGYPIDERPEILASLFNLGYQRSKPKKNPSVGGSTFKIHDTDYTFGAVAFEFYYSGELSDVFPFEKKRFDWQQKN